MRKLMYFVTALAICVGCAKNEEPKKEEPIGGLSFKIENVTLSPAVSLVSNVALYRSVGVKQEGDLFFARTQWDGKSVVINLTNDKYPLLKSVTESFTDKPEDYTVTLSNPNVKVALLNAVVGLGLSLKKEEIISGTFSLVDKKDYTPAPIYATDDVSITVIRKANNYKMELQLKKGWNMTYGNGEYSFTATPPPANSTWMFKEVG